MRVTISVPEAHLPGLAYLRDASPEQLASIDAAIGQIGVSLRFDDFSAALRMVVDAMSVENIEQVIFGLARVRSYHQLSKDELWEQLTGALAREPACWSTAQLARWSSNRALLQSILTFDSLSVCDKAFSLHYEADNVLSNVRILTDVRPVFDEGPTHVAAAIVSHSIRLIYFSGNAQRSITLSMDSEDLRRLTDACSRAGRKAVLVQDLLTRGQIPNRIPGETTDD